MTAGQPSTQTRRRLRRWTPPSAAPTLASKPQGVTTGGRSAPLASLRVQQGVGRLRPTSWLRTNQLACRYAERKRGLNSGRPTRRPHCGSASRRASSSILTPPRSNPHDGIRLPEHSSTPETVRPISRYFAGSPHGRWPSIRFLFVGAAFRVRLPSGPASRRAPLPSAIRFGATSAR